MAWARIDDNMPDHPKLARLGLLRPLAGWLHVCGICYATRYLTDGFIPAGQVVALTRFDHVGYETGGVPGMFSVGEDADPLTLAEALVSVGMWHHARGGYLIHDFLDYNPARDVTLKRRAETAARVKEHRERKLANLQASRESNGVTNALVTASPTPTPIKAFKSSSNSLVESNSTGVDPAVEILEFLNRKCDRRYRPVRATLDLIRARLRSGATVTQVKAVIVVKRREWAEKPDMAPYLRPSTLFRASNFETYLGQLPASAFEEL